MLGAFHTSLLFVCVLSRDIFEGPQRPVDRSNRNVRGNRSHYERQDDPELQADQDDLVRFPTCLRFEVLLRHSSAIYPLCLVWNCAEVL